MNNPIISIVVPVYKVASYIRSTLDSLLSQDYDNFEVILVDDGSPDESGVICDEYASKDKRVIVYHKENGGVTSARKLGVEKSTGEWIAFVDGDDMLTPDSLSTWITIAQTHNVDYVLTPMIYCSDTGQKLSKMIINGIYTAEEFRYLLCNEYANCGVGGRLISKKLFEQNTFSLPSNIVNNEDFFMNLNLTSKMHSMYAFPKKGLYKYILRHNSASHSVISESNWEAAYGEALRLIPVYGDCMGMYLVWSLYHRLFFKSITFEYAQEWIERIPNKRSYPIRLRLICGYMNNPSRFRYASMRIAIKMFDLLHVI